MLLSDALLLTQLEAGEIYLDRVSYVKVIIKSVVGSTVEAVYYNEISGLFVPYEAFDYSLTAINNVGT